MKMPKKTLVEFVVDESLFKTDLVYTVETELIPKTGDFIRIEPNQWDFNKVRMIRGEAYRLPDEEISTLIRALEEADMDQFIVGPCYLNYKESIRNRKTKQREKRDSVTAWLKFHPQDPVQSL